MKIFAYYYPGYFNDNYRSFGSEWSLVKKAIPRSPKHLQPKIPLNGYYEQDNLETAKQQIETAISFGIDGFMVCYYWDFENSNPIMNEPLSYLLEACKGLDFTINLMWVLRLPHKELPIEYGNFNKYSSHPWFKKRIQAYKHDSEFLTSIKSIAKHPNYRKDENGRPILQIYSVSEIIDHQGYDSTEKVFKSDFESFHLQGICGRDDEWISQSDKLGLHSISTYVTLVDFNTNKTMLKHNTCVLDQEKVWKTILKTSPVKFFPSISSGWDASPRGSFIQGFKPKKFPWSPVVIDSNPNDFFRNLQLTKQVFENNSNIDIHIASWNEWSEGHFIEPDTTNNYRFLEMIQKFKKEY
jgi:hypothetical protein